jgi:outer membrane immunogenic protein
MNRSLMPWLAAMAFSAPVHAQSLPSAFTDWEGVYIGFDLESFGDNALSFATNPLLTGTIDGLQLGGFIGYRHQFGNFVIGGELGANEGGTDTVLSIPIIAVSDSLGTRTSFLRAGVEAGYAFERFLPYATVGFASLTFRETALGNTRGTGQFYGFGLDYQTGEYGSVGFEVLRHEIDDFNNIGDLSVEATTFGINFAVRY